MGIYLIVCPLVFLAGFVDSIAGGGGLISLPAYMFAGIPVHNAIATNKLSSSTGTVVSTARLIKNKKVDWGFVPGTVIGALIGSVAGANLALIISDHILKMVLVVILPIVAFCVLRDKNMDVEVPVGMTKNKQYLIAIVCSLVIGCYDGFYGGNRNLLAACIYQACEDTIGESDRKCEDCESFFQYFSADPIYPGRENPVGTGTGSILFQYRRTLRRCRNGCE